MIPYAEFLRSLPRRPAIVAHRGAWRHGPENSIPAVLAAADMGCEIAEIDLQLSADGHLFLLHDEDLIRMTGHAAIAQDLPIDQIAGRLLRKEWGGPEAAFSEITLPRFETLLEAVRGRIYLDVDVKHGRYLEAAATAIAAAGMSGQAAIKVDVHNVAEAGHLCALQDEHGLMVMPKTRFTEETADELIELLARLGARVCETTFDRLDTIARRREVFARAGIAIWVNTLDVSHCGDISDSAAQTDPDSIWGGLVDAGVSIIQTDLPETLNQWRITRSAAA